MLAKKVHHFSWIFHSFPSQSSISMTRFLIDFLWWKRLVFWECFLDRTLTKELSEMLPWLKHSIYQCFMRPFPSVRLIFSIFLHRGTRMLKAFHKSWSEIFQFILETFCKFPGLLVLAWNSIEKYSTSTFNEKARIGNDLNSMQSDFQFDFFFGTSICIFCPKRIQFGYQ